MKWGKMKSVLYALLVGLVASCSGDGKDVIEIIEGMGGYARLVSLTSDEFDLKSIETTAFIYEVEFVTVDKGENVDVFEIYVGLNGADSILIKSYGQSDFVTNGDGYRSVEVNISLMEIGLEMGINVNELVTGDYFTFSSFVVLSNGSRYGYEKLVDNVRIVAAEGYMREEITMKCPLGEMDYVGTYAVTYVDPENATNCFEDIPTLKEEIPNFFLTNEGSSTSRKLTPEGGTIPWAASGFAYPGSSELEFICDQVQMIIPFKLNNDCGKGIELEGGPAAEIPYDFSDDSSFTITVTEFSSGDCDCEEIEFTLLFTKL